jgi:hypothetical protein
VLSDKSLEDEIHTVGEDNLSVRVVGLYTITSNQCVTSGYIFFFVTFPVYWLNFPRFKPRIIFLEGSSPVLAWGLDWFVCGGKSAGEEEG